MNNIFHLLIIAMFTLGVNACGYKAPPFYLDDTVHSDEHVEFKEIKQNSKKE